MKEIIGKKKCNSQILPKQILVNKIEVNDARSIGEKFNEFYVNVGPNLAKKSRKVTLILNLMFQK